MINASARRINYLASKLCLNSYLEIGVQDARTFDSVTVSERTGVDPSFRFDTTTRTNSKTCFYTQRSDEFFLTQPLSQRYDIIFIDGLHKFEQVLRDLCNSILVASSKFIIILDDTMPNDVYSTLPDVAATMRYRRAAGVEGGAWHGDVFKIIFFIHDFWPSLNYRTIEGPGNPQTIVWRSNSFKRKPLFGDLERISRLTYFDLYDRTEILRVVPEEDALSICLEDASRTEHLGNTAARRTISGFVSS